MHKEFCTLVLTPGIPVQAEECQELESGWSGVKSFTFEMGAWCGRGMSGTLKTRSTETADNKLGLMEEMVKFSGVIYLFMHKHKTRIKVLTVYSYLLWLDVYGPVDLNKDGCNSGHAAA